MIDIQLLSIQDSALITTRSAILISLLALLTYLLLQAFRRKYGKYAKLPPGPMGIAFLGYLPFLGKKPHFTLQKLKEKYGGLIGLYLGTKYTVSINEYSLLKEVFTHPGSLDRAEHLFDNIPNTGFLTENGEKWIEQRRFCLHASRDIGLGKGTWEDHMMEEVMSFIKKIRSTQGTPVDIYHDLTASVTSNIMSLLIGRRLRSDIEGDKIQFCIDYAHVVLSYLAPLTPSALIPGLRRFCEIFKIGGYDKALQIQENFYNFIREEVKKHKALSAEIDRDDFMSIYLKKLLEVSTGKKQHSFSETMLEGNVNVLFLGGSDTISSSLGWLMRLMAKHKDIQDKVYKELLEAVGKDGRARYTERQKFPYTFAVIMETQRYAEIVPISATRRANQDIPIKGYIIPKGAEISPNLYIVHHDPAYWKDPEKFKPERFLNEDGTRLIKQPPGYVPFSLGKRNCPGETVAWMEMLFYFSEIIKNFEISMPPGVEPEFKVVDGLVSRLETQAMCFKERA